MEWGNSQIKALAIATGIMGSLVLLLGIRLQSQAPTDVFMAEIDFQEPEPPPSPEPEIQLADPEPEAPEPTTLQAFNTEEKETKSSAPEKSQAENDFEQAEKALWAQGPIGSDYALKLKAIQRPDVLEEVDPKELTEKVYNKPQNTRIWYSLVGRMHRYIAVPIYICPSGGKVAVRIKVNEKGQVIETSIEPKQTTTDNGCLLENAQKYALQTLFDPSENSQQWGTIYYLFSPR